MSSKDIGFVGSLQQAGRVLAIATETGSGKAIAPVLRALAAQNCKVKAFLSIATLSFMNEQQKSHPREDFHPVSKDMSVQAVCDAFAPDVILVGTTATESAERRLTVYARDQNISTVAVIDERYGYGRRFSKEGRDLHYLTDIVTFMDEQCREDAIAEGLSPSQLYVTGSPILSDLFYHSSTITRDSGPSICSEDMSIKKVAFISETFVRDNGSSPSQSGRLGPFLGFTEETVRRDILAVLNEIGRPVVLIERMHPSDRQIPRKKRISDRVFWRQVNEGDLWSLLLQSDVVIGMRSMALLEAALLGCRTASYQPNLIGKNKCAAVRWGVAQRLDATEDLQVWLGESLAVEAQSVQVCKELPFIRSDAAQQVANLVLNAKRAP